MRRRRKKGAPLTKSEQMARVRSKDTQPELQLRRALWRAGIRYRLRPKLPGTPDLAFMRARVALFIDGCFWHGCPEHYRAPATNVDFWRRKVQANTARDRRVDEALAAMGWKVTRVWEHEIRGDLAAATVRIAATVRKASTGRRIRR